MKNTLYFGIILIIVIIINIFIDNFLIEGYTNKATKYATNEYNKEFGIPEPSNNNNTDYSYNNDPNYNVQYSANTYNNSGNIDEGTAYVFDKTRNVVELPPNPTGLNVNPTYYQPGTYKFGASTYVPNYEDSIYLSKSTGESTVAHIASMSKGFCSYYANQPHKLEEACMNINPNICASTSCCVLLGGSKCVSGNEEGPYMKEIYGDTTINRDYYYYKGKCYGNCRGNDIIYQSSGPSKTSDISNLNSYLSNTSSEQSGTESGNSTMPTDNSSTESGNSTTLPDNSSTESGNSTTPPDNSSTESGNSTTPPDNSSTNKLVTSNITQPVDTVTTITNEAINTV
jgi:hypothetical protein